MKVLLVSEGPSELGGSFQALVTRLGQTTFDISVDRVSRSDTHAHHGRGKGYFKRAVRWMFEARNKGYDALILVIDQDGVPQRTREIDEAQEFAGVPVRRALGVAIKTFDAWMLADEKALTEVLGYPVARQPDPEKITDPKSVCHSLLDGAEQDMKPAEMYASVAEIIDLHVLESRCRKGFAPFAQRVREC